MSRRIATRLAVEGGAEARREFERLGQTGQRALQRIQEAARPARSGLLAVDAAAREVRGGLGRFADRLGPVGRGLTALGPAGLAAGAALGALTLGLRAGIDAAALHEQALSRLQGVLRATGHASGLTARDLDRFAVELDRGTLATRNRVLEAAAVLATFRSVGRAAFTDTLRLAQDLAAVFGGDVVGQTRQLGRALEDPIQGLTALRRVGVSFTVSQRELIRTLAETGDIAGAQRAILAELERQVGGAGAAEARGLKGSVDGLALSWRLLLEELGRTPAVTGTAQGGVSLLTTALDGLRALVSGDAFLGLSADADIGQRIVATNRALLEAEARLQQLQERGSDHRAIAQEQRVARLRAQLDALIEQARAEADEQRRAEEGARAAAAERVAEQVAEVEDRLQQRLLALTTDRIQKVHDEEHKALAELEALRARGADPAAIDRVAARRRELTRREIEELERPRREAQERQAEQAARAAAARVAANARVAAGLERELELLTTLEGVERQRERAIDQAVARLQDPSPEAVARVRALAGALFDEARAQEEAAAAREAAARTLGAIDLQWRALQAAQGGAVAELQRWREETLASLDETAEGYEAFAARVEDIFHARLPAARRADLEASTEWRDGVSRALDAYVERSRDAGRAGEEVTRAGLAATEDLLVGVFARGELAIERWEQRLLEALTRIAVEQAILGPLTGALGSAFGEGGAVASAVGALFGAAQRGGVAGAPLPARVADPAVFHGAPRFRLGGFVGLPRLQPDEVPIIAHRGEEVLPADDPRHRRNRRRRERREITVHAPMTIVTPDANSFRASEGQVGARIVELLRRAERNL